MYLCSILYQLLYSNYITCKVVKRHKTPLGALDKNSKNLSTLAIIKSPLESRQHTPIFEAF